MKIYIDPRNSSDKAYVGPHFYKNIGCKKISLFRWRRFNEDLSNADNVISSSGDYSFTDDPKKADLILLQCDWDKDAEYVVRESDVDDICAKSEKVSSVVLNEPYIHRYHPLLFMFKSVIDTIEIGKKVQKINDSPNAFVNCSRLAFIKVYDNERYCAKSYIQPGEIGWTSLNYLCEKDIILEDGETGDSLHTFPPVMFANNLDRMTIFVDKINDSAFLAPLKADFFTLNGLKEWVIPGPEIIGQRVIFICESRELVNTLLRRRIKAVFEPDFLQTTSRFGSREGRQYVKELYDREFTLHGAYVEGSYKG